ncbi:MAG: lipoyl(octanoyl) transferase LipB, partial [Nitrosomonas sp.]|nr:lipoyl(octanoyl) transferase LipB [Nitrosomonas sp.]
MQNLSTSVCTPQHFIVKTLGLCDYQATWQAMKNFTDSRNEQTYDEIWLLQHPPVFTQGIAGKPEHLLHDHGIAVVKTDRGGQITYHGPGQIIAYLLLDIRRLKLGVRELVRLMESAVIGLLD